MPGKSHIEHCQPQRLVSRQMGPDVSRQPVRTTQRVEEQLRGSTVRTPASEDDRPSGGSCGSRDVFEDMHLVLGGVRGQVRQQRLGNVSRARVPASQGQGHRQIRSLDADAYLAGVSLQMLEQLGQLCTFRARRGLDQKASLGTGESPILPEMWILLACSPQDSTLQALVDARADQAVEDAELGVRFALAAGALSAEVAPLSATAWGTIAELEPNPDTRSALGLSGPGRVRSVDLTGAISVLWIGVELEEGVVGRLELEVVKPLESFRIHFAQQPDTAPGLDMEGEIWVRTPSDPTIEVLLEVSRKGARPQTVVIPLAEPAAWNGALLPDRGDFSWQQRHDGVERRVVGFGADTVENKTWPVVVSAEDWSALREMTLRY